MKRINVGARRAERRNVSADQKRTDARPHKYRAKPTVVDGIRFASQKEAKRYSELKLLEKAGEIHSIELQPKYPLIAVRLIGGGSVKVGDYVADFRYVEAGYRPFQDTVVVEDVKGFKTPVYRLKKKIVEVQYGIQIREV